MNLRLSSVWIALVAVVVMGQLAFADARGDLAARADKLAASAASLAQTAKASDDRGARKKFAPAASELGDDLAALGRRLGKDVPLKTVAKDAAGAEKDAAALVDLADEADEKEERKALRAQANLIAQGVTSLRKDVEAAAAKSDASAAAAPAKFTGRLVNNSDDCSWAENVKFVVSANGERVWTSGLVFPGRDTQIVLHKASYLVQVTDTVGKHLAQGTLAADREGWVFKSGCVNQD